MAYEELKGVTVTATDRVDMSSYLSAHQSVAVDEDGSVILSDKQINQIVDKLTERIVDAVADRLILGMHDEP